MDRWTVLRRCLLTPFGQGAGKELNICQTRSHTIIAYDSVPVDCIEKAVSENGVKTVSKTLYVSVCSTNNFQKCLERTAAAATAAAAARHLGEYRDTFSGAKPGQSQQQQQRRYREYCSERKDFIPS